MAPRHAPSSSSAYAALLQVQRAIMRHSHSSAVMMIDSTMQVTMGIIDADVVGLVANVAGQAAEVRKQPAEQPECCPENDKAKADKNDEFACACNHHRIVALLNDALAGFSVVILMRPPSCDAQLHPAAVTWTAVTWITSVSQKQSWPPNGGQRSSLWMCLKRAKRCVAVTVDERSQP